MSEQQLLQEGNPFLYKRFRQIVFASQLALTAGALNAILFGLENIFADNFIGIRLDIAVLLGGAILITVVQYLLKAGQPALAGAVYVWLVAVVMSFVTWIEGGLYSLAVLSFPLIFVFAALFTKHKVFVSVFISLSTVIILLGLNHIYSWYPAPEEMMVHGVPRVVGGLVITTVSGYVALVIGNDMKRSLTKLQMENQRVIDSQKVIRRLADRDSLTGLYNRNAAKEIYERMLSGLVSTEEQIVFYFIDLDNFKDINDLFDHHAGDQLLITIANRLKALTGNNDVACRLGGDEFVVFYRSVGEKGYDAFANRLTNAVAQPHFIIGTEAEVTASIGIAIVGEENISFDEVRKKADKAMYMAKQSGKNQFHYYSDELNEEYMRNLNIINRLKDALSHDLLDLHYQPKVHLGSNSITGAEALLRWERGNPLSFQPDEFIPVIESTELVHDIGAWVIQESCRACKGWHEAGHFISVSANVSTLQLTRANFYDIVAEALGSCGLDPQYLEIELTEHLLVQENKEVRGQLAALKKLGVGLSIDDFGTGYSNMNYLTRLKVDVLKLDRSFISQLAHSEEYLVVVTAIIQMAKVLGMEVVAEGIESKREREILLGLNCDYAQGFLWSRAISNKAFVPFVSEFSSSIK